MPLKLSIFPLMKIMALLGTAYGGCYAQNVPPLPENVQKSLQKYNTYLNQLTEFFVDLTQQVDKDGGTQTSRGRLYVKKPGKLRLSYQPAHTLDLIADGKDLIQYDWVNNDKNAISLQETPLYFLLHRGKLQDLAIIQKIIVSPETHTTKIMVKSRQDPEAGTVTLEFHDAPIRLTSWTLTDPQGRKTKVMLGKIHRNVSIDPKIFILKSPGK
jgi:outer membrane lipoprotein-sorting protein